MFFCLYFVFFRSFSYEHWGTLKPGFLCHVGVNFVTIFFKWIEITTYHKHMFLGETRDSKRVLKRPLTCRTEIKVERVRQVVCNNYWLIFSVGRTLLKRKNTGCGHVWKVTGLVPQSIHQLVDEKNVDVLKHPPYSYDPALSNLFFSLSFPFWSPESIKRVVTTELIGIPEESFQECVETWKRMTRKCVKLEGNSFEEENMYFIFGIELNYLWHQTITLSDTYSIYIYIISKIG